MINTDMKSDVSHAAIAMDEFHPGWYDKVAGKDFNVLQASNCVLFHATGNFRDSFKELVDHVPSLVGTHTFTCVGMTEPEIGNLNAYWRQEIERRIKPTDEGRRGVAPERVLVTA